jgi:hypothetical protein
MAQSDRAPEQPRSRAQIAVQRLRRGEHVSAADLKRIAETAQGLSAADRARVRQELNIRTQELQAERDASRHLEERQQEEKRARLEARATALTAAMVAIDRIDHSAREQFQTVKKTLESGGSVTNNMGHWVQDKTNPHVFKRAVDGKEISQPTAAANEMKRALAMRVGMPLSQAGLNGTRRQDLITAVVATARAVNNGFKLDSYSGLSYNMQVAVRTYANISKAAESGAKSIRLEQWAKVQDALLAEALGLDMTSDAFKKVRDQHAGIIDFSKAPSLDVPVAANQGLELSRSLQG